MLLFRTRFRTSRLLAQQEAPLEPQRGDSREAGSWPDSPPIRWALRDLGSPEGATSTGTDPRKVTEEPPALACARCQEPVTSAAEWLEVGGAREHTFMNPHGFAFRIGCFAAARALEGAGGWSDEWSWFPPCLWQVQHCARCGEHLGWAFRSADRRFFGLVLDRLVQLGRDGASRL